MIVVSFSLKTFGSVMFNKTKAVAISRLSAVQFKQASCNLPYLKSLSFDLEITLTLHTLTLCTAVTHARVNL
jgi:hypothetical protein